MLKRICIAAIAVGLAGSLFAQATTPNPTVIPNVATSASQVKVIGKTDEVEGLVTVGIGSEVRKVENGLPLIEGSRFVTGSNGYVTLRFDRGCDIRLKPNQMLVVDREGDCAALLLAIAGTGATSSGILPLILIPVVGLVGDGPAPRVITPE
jgi:hypothetical protein